MCTSVGSSGPTIYILIYLYYKQVVVAFIHLWIVLLSLQITSKGCEGPTIIYVCIYFRVGLDIRPDIRQFNPLSLTAKIPLKKQTKA